MKTIDEGNGSINKLSTLLFSSKCVPVERVTRKKHLKQIREDLYE